MKINIEKTTSGDVICVSVDEQLDMTAYQAFGEAAELAVNNYSSSAIVVDLGKTQRVFDSGRAMLLSLYQRAGRLKHHIYLTNINPDIKYKLAQGKFSSLFHIVQGET